MVETSTLIYLVDDFNMPSDMILSQNFEPILTDEYLLSVMDLAEIDPGEELVHKVLEKIKD